MEEWGPGLFPLNKVEAAKQWPPQPGRGGSWQEEQAGNTLGLDTIGLDTSEPRTQMWAPGQARLFQHFFFFFFNKTHLLHTRR